ncbi:MAG: hypothetical protein Q7T72_07985 [Bacteroidales bacterium]|nr:hypothetical protein [Bacteroidales bacterium]
MEISELTFKIVLLFIPGAITSLIVDQLTIHKEWNAFRFIVNSIVLGVVTYLFVQLIYLIPCINPNHKTLDFWQPTNNTKIIPYLEILYASIVGVILGFIFTLGIQKKWIFKLARLLKVSSKYGDECLYYYFLNAKDLSEVYVRDHEQNLTYHGFIQAFSESNFEREIVLTNVDVYNLSDSTFLYNSDAIFLSKPKDKIWQIEIPVFKNSKLKSKKNAKKSNPKRKD